MTIDLKELFHITSQVNAKVAEKLLSALKSAFLSEFDYLKFKKSYMSLLEMGMDEMTAMKSAFMTASTMGLTKEKLLDNTAYYKSVLNKEREQFASALKHQISSNIDSRTMDIKKLMDKKEENERKITELQNQREVIDNEIRKINQDIELHTERIHTTRDNFKNTFDHLFSVIEKDEETIKNIL